MSIPVALDELASKAADYGFAYLLTSGEGDSAPHAVAVSPVVGSIEIAIVGLGARTRTNAQVRPAVSLVWPPSTIDQYSLIVDGNAHLDGERLIVRPTRAVLHRPAPAPSPSEDACGSDCQEILPRQ